METGKGIEIRRPVTEEISVYVIGIVKTKRA